MGIFGCFDQPGQTTPSHDPGLDVACPYCLRPLSRPLKTISLMREGDTRSWFYRAHKACYEAASALEIQEIESALIDAR